MFINTPADIAIAEAENAERFSDGYGSD